MTFSTWQSDDCDRPDWRGLESAIKSLAISAQEIASDLQQPADAVVSWLTGQEAKIRRRLDSQARALIKQIDEAAGLIYGPLMQSANAQLDAIRGSVAQVHAAVLRAGRTDIAIPPLLGSVLPTASALSEMPESAGEYEPAPSPDSVLANGHVYTQAAQSTIVPQGECRPVCPPGMQPETYDADADWTDHPHAFLFGERSAEWHRRMRAFYAGALDAVIDAPTINDAVAARVDTPSAGRGNLTEPPYIP